MCALIFCCFSMMLLNAFICLQLLALTKMNEVYQHFSPLLYCFLHYFGGITDASYINFIFFLTVCSFSFRNKDAVPKW